MTASSRQQLRSNLKLQAIQVKDELLYAVPIRGYAGYMASTCGRIISFVGHYNGQGRRFKAEPRILQPQERCNGYKKVILTSKSEGKAQMAVHRLVALAFLEQDSVDRKGHQRTHVNHINGNPSDNRLCNLELVTPLENNQWSRVLADVKSKAS